MKRVLLVLAILAASVSYSSAGFAAERTRGLLSEYNNRDPYQTSNHKDECLIVAKNCAGNNETARIRAERLRREINKGSVVYSKDELKRLQDQLDWINSENEGNSGSSIY